MAGAVEIDSPSPGITRLTLLNPGKANALSPSMAGQLLEAYDVISADPGCGCVIVRGGGRHFCSGGDRSFLSDLSANPLEADHYARNEQVYSSFRKLGQLPVPTVAAVRGAAVGAGVNLMLATDLVIVAEEARIISGFVELGIHPGGGHYHLVARRAGAQVAAALSLFGEEFSGVDCKRVGLAWDAVPDEDVDDRAIALGKRVARDPALARACVRSLRLEGSSAGQAWDLALEAERGVQAWSMMRKS